MKTSAKHFAVRSNFMYTITLIPGDGIGPDVAFAAKKLIDAVGVKINWDIKEAGEKMIKAFGSPLPPPVIASIRKNKIALKGPISTPVGEGFRSVNVALRKEFDLYANVSPAKTYKGIPSRYADVDIVIIRANIED